MGSTFNSFLREITAFAGVLGRLYGFWVLRSGPEGTPNCELPESHSRTWGTYGPQWSRCKWLTLIPGLVRLDNQNRNLEPNLWYMLPGMILRTARPQILNHRLISLCCGSEPQSEVKVDVGSKIFHNGQVSAVSSNGAEKSETHIDTLEPASTGASFPGKKILPYTDDVVNDFSPITLSNEGFSGTTKVQMTNAASERVDRGTP